MSPASVRRALKSLPKTLDETYDRILGSIEEECHKAAHTVLQWLAFAARPLRLEEIAEVVALVLGGRTGFVDDRLSDSRDILAICSSLVTISTNSYDLSDGSSGEVSDVASVSSSQDLAVTLNESPQIYLAHYSVKEYLTSNRILACSASAFATFEIPANRNITQLCLTYLSVFDKPDSLTAESLTVFPLLGYAARYWYDHARMADEQTGIDSQICSFLNDTKTSAFLNWLRIWEPDSGYRRGLGFLKEVANPGSPLYYACYCGLPNSAVSLIKGGADVNTQGGLHGNALQAAAVSEHAAVSAVKQLLEAGADVNARGGCWSTALLAAVAVGNILIVKLLLEAGADVNAHFGSALQAAAIMGNPESGMRLLPEADVNAQGGCHGNVLKTAAFFKHKEMFDLLLEHGAVVTEGGDFDSPWDPALYGALVLIRRLRRGSP